MKNLKSRLVVFLMLGAMLAATLLAGACPSPSETTAPPTTKTTAPPTTTAPPPEPIKLTYASILAETTFYEVATLNWIDKIEKETNGLVQIEPYFGGTLITAKEGYAQLAAGQVDIAHCSWTYGSGFDLLKKMGGFMYGVKTTEQQHLIDEALRAKYPEIEQDFTDVKIMARCGGNVWYAFTAGKAVRTLDDFRGLTLKTQPAQTSLLQSLGGEPINPPSGEIYVDIQKGILDGLILDWSIVNSYNLHEVLDYYTALNLGTRVAPWKFMNLDTWNSLPPDIQKVFDDNVIWYGEEIDRQAVAIADEGEQKGIAAGMEGIELSAADLAEFYELCKAACMADVAALDAMGLPGTGVFNDIRAIADKFE
jgi:TRAP-type C4-dicarboxylate transport system substrate-binding protein